MYELKQILRWAIDGQLTVWTDTEGHQMHKRADEQKSERTYERKVNVICWGRFALKKDSDTI